MKNLRIFLTIAPFAFLVIMAESPASSIYAVDTLSVQDTSLWDKLKAIESPDPPDTTGLDRNQRNNKHWAYCRSYWKYKQELNQLKPLFFEQEILKKALQNPEVSEVNKNFLRELSKHLKTDSDNSLVPETILFPIMKQQGLPHGIFGSWRYREVTTDRGSRSFTIANPEKALMETIPPGWYDSALENNVKVRFSEKVMEKAPGLSKIRFNTYGLSQSAIGQVTGFARSISECIEYFYYSIEMEEPPGDNTPLIGSSMLLDLEQASLPETDKALNALSAICLDCPASDDYQVFARLKGIDGLYFTYSNSYPTPGRELVMKMGQHYVTLWQSSLDLFGCSCL